MPESKAYKLPNKEKFPELYKKIGGLFKKGTKKLGDVIENYALENMQPQEASNIQNFLNIQGKEKLKKEAIFSNLAEYVGKGLTREIEFVLELQGEKLKKEDMLKHYNEPNYMPCTHYSPLWRAVNYDDKNKKKPLLVAAETLYDIGEPLTKEDFLTEKRHVSYNVNQSKLIKAACKHGSLDQVKTIVEMNGEKLTKKDLMSPTSGENPFDRNRSIAFTTLRNNQFDVVEQVLTEEGKTLCINDVIDDFKELGKTSHNDKSKALSRFLSSSVFKDTSENIKEMWKVLPDEFKTTSSKNYCKKAISSNMSKEKLTDAAKSAAKALNKAGIASIKSKAGR
ncbi:MAG: hypothetical protein KAJ75_00895 [Alphaproteobacteria bacterium]|nr:hypothetical protein [Alphaproteobacteria bacterium]